MKYEAKEKKPVALPPKTNLRLKHPKIPVKAAFSTLQILLMTLCLLFIVCVVLFIRVISISSKEEKYEGPEGEPFLSYHEHKL